MFCPFCGHENPDAARYCMSCGKSPETAFAPKIQAQTRAKEPEKQQHLRNGLLLLAVAFIVGAVFLRSTRQRHVEPLTPSAFTVKAGTIYYVKFNVLSPARLFGRFEASGGQGNDIQVVVATADGFENWQNGHQAPVLYQTDKTTVGTLNVSINTPGTYYLGFNNKFSLFADKQITASIQLSH